MVGAALFFLLPLWIMILTSLKTMDEIRLGNLLALPADPTIEPWITAWGGPAPGSPVKASGSASGTRSAS